MTSAGSREAGGPFNSILTLALPAATVFSALTSEVTFSMLVFSEVLSPSISVAMSMINVLDFNGAVVGPKKAGIHRTGNISVLDGEMPQTGRHSMPLPCPLYGLEEALELCDLVDTRAGKEIASHGHCGLQRWLCFVEMDPVR